MNTSSKGRFKYTITILLVAIGCTFFTCKRPPNYPDTPMITFESINYSPTPAGTIGGFDTITLTVYFQDGDGDLGLEANETEAPYNAYNVMLNDNGDTIRFGDPGATDFNYYDFEVVSGDTLRVERNPFFYNFIVDFYEETSPDNYEVIDYRDWCINNNVCIPFHGRFEPISEREKSEPLEGTISYDMVSSQFPTGNIKFGITIYDRSLNVSNTVLSSVITVE